MSNLRYLRFQIVFFAGALKSLPLFFYLATACLFARAADKEPHRPHIVAHRGLLRNAPENTLANFRACLNLRLGFEFDVRRAKDGQLVCLHDETLDRTTDGKGKVGEYTVEQLQLFDAGSWFDPAFRNERIPTIDQVFALIAEHKHRPLLFAADMKGDDAQIEADVVKLAEHHGILDRLLFIGRTIDHPEVRRRLKAANANVHTAALANVAEEFDTALNDADADWVYLRFVPTSAQMQTVHKASKRAFIAGPKVAGLETANWRGSFQAGMDAILTDYPHELAELVRSGTTAPQATLIDEVEKEFADFTPPERAAIVRLQLVGTRVYRRPMAAQTAIASQSRELIILIPSDLAGTVDDLSRVSQLKSTQALYIAGNLQLSDDVIAELRKALPSLIVDRRNPAKLGISIPNNEGPPQVGSVQPESGAATAGILKGDVLLEFAGTRLTKIHDLTEALLPCKPGQQVEVLIRRDLQELKLKVTLTGWK
jgi:glycerophosphoryl diester phosphodiesterase